MTVARPNVADTARYAAAARAAESARADALFKDPYAERFSGELGRNLINDVAHPQLGGMDWGLVTRTAIIDDMVRRSMAEGVDRVVNMGAGFDTRPYRLNLPADFSWFEADAPSTMDEKNRVLAGDKPTCRLERVGVDLSIASESDAFLKQALSGARRALVITEGVLAYLEPETVRVLGRDLHSRPEVGFWVHDIVSPMTGKLITKRHSSASLDDSARLRFAPADGVRFLQDVGWRPVDIVSLGEEGRRRGRAPFAIRLLSYLKVNPERPGKMIWLAVIRATRA